MSAWTNGLNQTATYWPPVGNDGFGNKTFGTPTLITCRWQNKSELFRDSNGREVMSNAIVYPDRELEVRGLLALGDHTGVALEEEEDATQKPSALAYEIRSSGASPALHTSLTLYKVIL